MGSPRIPEDFELLVRNHIRASRGEERDSLSAYDFPLGQSVQLRFIDGSFAQFEHAFFLEDPTRGLVAVFTEHCGYHVFPSDGAKVSLVRVITHGGNHP